MHSVLGGEMLIDYASASSSKQLGPVLRSRVISRMFPYRQISNCIDTARELHHILYWGLFKCP